MFYSFSNTGSAVVIPNHILGLNPAVLLTNILFVLYILCCYCFSVTVQIPVRILMIYNSLFNIPYMQFYILDTRKSAST